MTSTPGGNPARDASAGSAASARSAAPHARDASRTAADVGRWFSTAAPGTPEGTASRTGSGRGLPRLPAWGPSPADAYGTTSPPAVLRDALDHLRSRRIAVLTGAGMSTASGLPDYRGPRATPRSPMTFQEFRASDLSRRRYWARSTVGWTQFASARPNGGHRMLARLAERLSIRAVITQNVDGLHERAGSDPVIDLHGRLDRVRCLSCGTLGSRERLHERLLAMNPDVARRLPDLAADAASAPDGDAEVDRTDAFRYPPCAVCGGILKPDVVFFGEAARPEVVVEARRAVTESEVLLVLGSSLTVMSGLRFVRQAVAQEMPVVIVNDGPTRGDALATVRVHGRIEDVLGRWSRELGHD